MAKVFEANPVSVYDFISKNGRGLYIPAYQRPYAWDKNNVERLFADIVQGLESCLSQPDEAITFLGTIIALNDIKRTTIQPLVKHQIYSQVMSIIDGQQRLTSLLMFCVALLVEIEKKWASIKKYSSSNSDENDNEIINWCERSFNDVKGLLQQMLSEEQRNGIEEYRHFPKMIRAFVDTWSYEEDKAEYKSAIAWLLFEYIKNNLKDEPKWGSFIADARKKAKDTINDPDINHLLNMVKIFESKLDNLDENEDVFFPTISQWLSFKSAQEKFFGETLPDEMHILDSELIGIDEKKIKWLNNISQFVRLLGLAKFTLNHVTIVSVEASSEDFAFDVFEALNSTGQPLTAIETFVPLVVQKVGVSAYEKSKEKKLLDKIIKFTQKEEKSAKKQKRSTDLVTTFYLTETGEKCISNLSDQRASMRKAFSICDNDPNQQELFLKNLTNIANFYQYLWITDSGKEKPQPQFCNPNAKLSDLAGLCLRFLVSIKHTITIPLLSLYTQDIENEVEQDKTDLIARFDELLLAVTAFTVLWRSSRTSTDRIDQFHRDLMLKGDPTIGLEPLARQKRKTDQLPDVSLIKRYFKNKLELDGIVGETEWSSKVNSLPLFKIGSGKEISKFLLLAAFNDVTPDQNEPYKLVKGKPGTFETLTIKKWDSPHFETIEHIAPQQPQTNSRWETSDIYRSSNDVHKLGNLTILPIPNNSSLGNREWDIKRKLFSALSATTTNETQAILKILSDDGVFKGTNSDLYCGVYLPHLNVLSKYPHDWTSQSIEIRGKEITSFAWSTLNSWL
ncbi:DUF262 domain-containing HNH endonuclease family protein [Acinetobacter sp.]|uniref:DUF262 domain-containing protein n=1 Tax=Acinetobacter sp. TaxID=472 RepID=UPI0012CD434D|nr:DUF262 domain-containing HNH endonuclease family protein [Acinetobacter sp.]MPS62975.1 DUF262 domain-containing protein [Acinetobacter sp.]